MITKRNGRVRMQEKWLVIALILMITLMPFTFLVSRQESRKRYTCGLQPLRDVSLCANQQDSSGTMHACGFGSGEGQIGATGLPGRVDIVSMLARQC